MTVETNSWRIAKASRASLIVDADDYFRAGRLAMLSAKRRIMLIGWDFDARIDLGCESELEGPPRLGDFVLWLVKRRPDLESTCYAGISVPSARCSAARRSSL